MILAVGTVLKCFSNFAGACMYRIILLCNIIPENRCTIDNSLGVIECEE